jgi:hypothetical protein
MQVFVWIFKQHHGRFSPYPARMYIALNNCFRIKFTMTVKLQPRTRACMHIHNTQNKIYRDWRIKQERQECLPLNVQKDSCQNNGNFWNEFWRENPSILQNWRDFQYSLLIPPFNFCRYVFSVIYYSVFLNLYISRSCILYCCGIRVQLNCTREESPQY